MRLLISTAASIVVASGAMPEFIPLTVNGNPLPAKPARKRPGAASRPRQRGTTVVEIPSGRGRSAAVLAKWLPETVQSDPRREEIREYFRERTMTPGKWKTSTAKSFARVKLFSDDVNTDEFEAMVQDVFKLEDYYNFLVPRYMEDRANHFWFTPSVNTTTFAEWLKKIGGTLTPDQAEKVSEQIQDWRLNCHAVYFSRWFVKQGMYGISPKELEKYFFKYYDGKDKWFVKGQVKFPREYIHVRLDTDEPEKEMAFERVDTIFFEHSKGWRDENLDVTDKGKERKDIVMRNLKIRGYNVMYTTQ